MLPNVFLTLHLSLFQDKTFGLKNKKGGKNQKYIAQVEKQVKSGGNPLNRKREEELKQERKLKEERRKLGRKDGVVDGSSLHELWSL